MKIVLEGTEDEVLRLLSKLNGATPKVSIVEDEVVEATALPEEFVEMVNAWTVGFDPTGTQHWGEDGPREPLVDRPQLLRQTLAGKQGAWILDYIHSVGGLTQAVHAALDGENPELAQALAGHMAQLGSLVCPPLTDTYNPATVLE